MSSYNKKENKIWNWEYETTQNWREYLVGVIFAATVKL